MGAAFLPIAFFTILWSGVGIGLPLMLPKNPHQALIRCILMLTAATCYLFWLCCYLAQSNPLIGPKLHRNTIYMMAKNWGNELKDG